MEQTGYILFFTGIESYFNEYGATGDPFDANFYINQESAIKLKNELEEIYNDNIKVIKVKRTIKILGGKNNEI